MNKKTLGISLLALLISQNVLATHPKAEYQLGFDSSVGGYIFWLNGKNGKSGDHGLVAAASDLSITFPWNANSATSTIYLGAIGNGFGAGQINIPMIVEASLVVASPPVANPPSAASGCLEYCTSNAGEPVSCPTSSNTSQIYSDWYLPSAYELSQLLYVYGNHDGGVPPTISHGLYWSSTEFNNSQAYVWPNVFQTSAPPEAVPTPKTELHHVHCIRKF